MDSDQRRFEYASVLSRSAVDQDLQEAALHLEHIINNNTASYFRDALYLLSIVRYSLNDMDAARSCVEELLRFEPSNPQVSLCLSVSYINVFSSSIIITDLLIDQAKNLHTAIKYRIEKQRESHRQEVEEVGVAVGLGMGLAVVGLGLAFLLRRR
jgi:tetratricopeptide (TPR) repeat protein